MRRLTLLYDEDCGFCRASVEAVTRWDRAGHVRVATLQSDEAAELLASLGSADRFASAHLVTADGRVYSAGAIAAPLFRSLPGGWPLAALAEAMPGTTERAYRLVARNRYRISGWLGQDACPVDRPEVHAGVR